MIEAAHSDHFSPAYAGNHSYQAVEECTAGVLRNLAKGDKLRKVPPRTQKEPRLSSRGTPLHS